MSALHHVTLSTGHTRLSPRSEVSDEALAALTPLLDGPIGEVPGQPGYRLSPRLLRDPAVADCGYMFHVIGRADLTGDRSLCVGAVARNAVEAAVVWPEIQAVMEAWGTSAGCPMPPTPWVAVVLRPAIAEDPLAMRWLGDLERCVAWAWIEREGGAR